MNLEKIYSKLPGVAKTLLLNVKALINHRKRFTPSYKEYLSQYKSLWDCDLKEIKTFQTTALRALLEECYDFVPYYQSIFKEKGITKQAITQRPWEVLDSLPLLDKESRRHKAEALCNTNPNRPLVETGYTSGTSGSPTVNYQDAETIERGFALWARFQDSIGIQMKDRSIRFSGRLIVAPTRKKPPFWIHNYIDDQLFMSSYHLSANHLPSYIDKINRFKPVYLDGYPSALYVIAQYSLDHDLPITARPKAITTTAETLYDYQREKIEQAFGCPVYNQYASSEGAPLIADCKQQRLHMHLDSGIFEFLNDQDQAAAPGSVGRLVATSFRNLKTPLLRYDILDTVLLPETQHACSCGNHWPYVEKIIGREDDVLWTEEKGYVGRMDTAYKGLKGIIKSQIIQDAPDHFIINNVVDAQFTPQMKQQFIKNLQDRLGQAAQYDMYEVADIPLGPNGKFDAVKRTFKL